MLKQTNHKGFTIIEVVITIAIGAAVMALVLNAVAGARRSQRNQARVNDVGTIAGAVNDYIANRNTLPSSWGAVDNSIEDLNQYAAGGAGTAASPYGTSLLGVNAIGNTATSAPFMALGAPTQIGGATDQYSTFPGVATTQTTTQTPATGSLWEEDDQQDRHDRIAILRNAKCDETNTGPVYGGVRRMVILYKLEGQDGITCRDI